MLSRARSVKTGLLGREFQHILVDLDDTLYRNEKVAQAMSQHIQAYMHEKLHIPAEQVQQLTQALYREYGTTMAGLSALGYHIDFVDWHAHVHGTLDYKHLLHPQPAVRQVLLDMVAAPSILTNADANHVQQCLTQMELSGCFQNVFCFESIMQLAEQQGVLNGKRPVLCKPSKEVYLLVLQQLATQPDRCIFIDDSVRNVASAHEHGIFTVLVAPQLVGQHVPGADVVVSSFCQLKETLPQLFVTQEKWEEVPASVSQSVSVMAS